MADILLTVGANVKSSYAQLSSDIRNMVRGLDASEIAKVKIKFEADQKSLNEVRAQIAAMRSAVNTAGEKGIISVTAGTDSSVKRISASKQATTALKEEERAMRTAELAEKRYMATSTRLSAELKRLSAAKRSSNQSSRDAYRALSSEKDALDKVYAGYDGSAKAVKKLEASNAAANKTWAQSKKIITENGDATTSLSQRMGGLAKKFGSWLTVSTAIMFAVRTARQMVQASIELDTAMTELKKVTDETDETYARFLDKASERAKKLGVSLSDVVTASADFARLGYSIEDAEKLADTATVYKNVGDGIKDINEASESIIATMQAFGIEANDAMSIVDKFNAVGNNYAISSKGVGEALLRSAAAMQSANNTLDETVALAAAANTIVQNPEKVGTVLKTVSMYLRAAKTEMEAAGESTDGIAVSVSKLRKEILSLTNGKVDIQLDENTFKSTYQILKELSEVWSELSDVTQANILERIGGKRNANVVAAILNNFNIAEKALRTSAESAGSALEENTKHLDSVSGRLGIFKASFQMLAADVMSKDRIKFWIDLGTNILNAADAVAKFANAIGGLPTVLGAISGYFAAKGNGLIELTGSGDGILNQISILGKSISKIQSSVALNSLKFHLLSDQDIACLKAYNEQIKSGVPIGKAWASTMSTASKSGKQMAVSLKRSGLSVDQLSWSMIKAKVQTIALRAATVALNMALTMGLAFAAQKAVEGINKLIHAQENASKEADIQKAKSMEDAQAARDEATQINELIEKYKELAASDTRDVSTRTEIKKVQDEISDLVGEQADNLDLVNGKLDEQLEKLYAIRDGDKGYLEKSVQTSVAAYNDAKKSFDKAIMKDAETGKKIIEYKGKVSDEQIRALGEYSAYVGTNQSPNNPYRMNVNLSDSNIKGAGERVKILNEMISRLQTLEDYSTSELYTSLVKARNYYLNYVNDLDKASKGLLESSVIVAATNNDLADNAIQSVEAFEGYREALINAVKSDPNLKGAMEDGKITGDDIESQVTNHLASIDKISKYYNEWKNKHLLDNVSQTFLNNFKNGTDAQKQQLEDAKQWFEGLSSDDRNLIYTLELDTRSADWELSEWEANFKEYKENQKSIDTRALLKGLWESTDFKETKASLEGMVEQFGKISPKQIKEVAKESTELQAILDSDGMSAEFLAHVLTQVSLGEDGFSLITEGALELNEALNGMTDAFEEVSDAKTKYDEAMSANEKDTNFKSIAEAFEVLNQQFVEGKINSNAFWASAEFIFGSNKLKEFGYDVDKIYKAMAQNAPLFKDAESGGFAFLDKLYSMSKSGKVFDNAGNVIAEISKLSNGNYDFKIDYDNIDAIANSMNLSKEAVLSCLEAISMFGDIDFYNINEVADSLEKAGVAVGILDENGNKIGQVVDIDKLTKQLRDLGKSEKDINNITNDLKKLGNIDFIGTESNANDLILSLEKLKIASKDGANINVNYESLVGLMRQLGYTKEEAEALVGKFKGMDNISFTNAEGKTMQFDSVVSQLGEDFGGVEDKLFNLKLGLDTLSTALNNLDGKSVTVKIDFIGSMSETVKHGWNAVKNTTKNLVGGVQSNANGTDNASKGKSLVGESGEELVLTKGRAYFVGTYGAEFVNLEQGDKVYTAEETKKIKNSHRNLKSIPRFEKGKSGGAYGSAGNKGYGSVLPDSSSGSKNKKSSSNKSSKTEKEPEVIDWIETAIARLKRVIDNLARVAESSFKTLSKRLSATNSEIIKVNEEIALQAQAADRYMRQANSIGLSADLAKKVRDGAIDIREYDEETAKLIKSYDEWHKKSLDCRDAIDELHESLASLYKDKFDNIATDFDNQLALMEHMTNTYNNGMDNIEERGYLATTKYYEAMRKIEQENINIRKKELNDLTIAMSEAINSGEIEEGSEAWYDFQKQINDVKESIQESETAMIEFNNAIRETEWGHFDYLQEQISGITEEADFLIDLMEHSDLYTDNGQLTDTGMAAMGLHGQNYNVYMAQADKYAEEILKLNEEIANDTNNTKLLERREELLEAQRESILAAEDEKDAIVDMVREGIELELDALQDLIDKYNQSLDAAKDLHDYQKKIKDQTSEIAKLQKQLSAYSGDTSEESRATIQKIKVDLSEAMDNLEETEYDHYISEQKRLLDDLYNEYETILNERLDNIDALISDMIDDINANSTNICDTLMSESDKVGYTITENERAIWSPDGEVMNVLSMYGKDFSDKLTTVNATLSRIELQTMGKVEESDKLANNTINNTAPTTPVDKNVKPPSSPKQPSNPPKQPAKPQFNDNIKKGIAMAIWVDGGAKSGWGNDPDRKKRLTAKFGSSNAAAVQKYINAHGSNGDLYREWNKSGKKKLSQYYYSAFKKGGLNDYTGWAWLDGTPSEPEAVLNSEDTKNLISLRDVVRGISDGTNPLSELFNEDSGAMNVLKQLAQTNSPLARTKGGTSIGDITYQISIPIDHVQDYEDFVNQMRKDGKFEKMIQSMTVDRLVGGSKLAKNRYQW